MLDFFFSWDFLWWLMMLLYIPSSLGLIVIVLLQKGKGAGFAGAFGVGGGSETVFGPRTSRSLPQRLTYTMAGIFLLFALILSTLSGKVGRGAAPELVDEGPALESAALDALFEEPGAEEATEATQGMQTDITPVEITPVDDGAVTEAEITTEEEAATAEEASAGVEEAPATAEETPAAVEEAPATAEEAPAGTPAAP